MDENRIVTRTIAVTWGGELKELPVLPMNPADTWRKSFAEKFPENDKSDLSGAEAMSMVSDKLVDLIMAYDRTKVLGTREWIEENVTDDELADAFVEVFRRSFRPGRLLQELTMALLRPQPARSPNGHSPTGALTPISSGTGSPTSS